MAGDAGPGVLQNKPLALRPGERWRLTVRLKAPTAPATRTVSTHELWLWEQGVQATGYVRADRAIRLPGASHQPGATPSAGAPGRSVMRLSSALPRCHRAGACVRRVWWRPGDRRPAGHDRADWDVFRATGVAHLMSISGLHITLFAWLAAAMVRWFWRRSPRLCLAVPCAVGRTGFGVLLAAMLALFSGWACPRSARC